MVEIENFLRGMDIRTKYEHGEGVQPSLPTGFFTQQKTKPETMLGSCFQPIKFVVYEKNTFPLPIGFMGLVYTYNIYVYLHLL